MSELFCPSYDGILDIRTAGILQDKTHADDKCAPGAARAAIKGPFFRARPPNPQDVDTKYDWVLGLTAVFLVMIVYGINSSYPIFFPFIEAKYNMDRFHMEILGGVSLGVFVILLPCVDLIVDIAGSCLTVVFGLCLYFFALFFQFFDIPATLFCLLRGLIIPIAMACIYNPAMNAVADHFHTNLALVLMLLSSSPVIGTFVFYCISSFLAHNSLVGYNWTMVIFAMLLLMLCAAAFSLPKAKPVDLYCNEDLGRGQRIEECLKRAARERAIRDQLDPEEQEMSTYLCVCTFKVRYNVASFNCAIMLWAVLTTTGVMVFNFPYWFMVEYGYDKRSSPLGLIFWFSCASILGRVFVITNIDHRFIYNRALFQSAMMCSGLLMAGFTVSDTYGWLLVWGIGMGIFIGILSAVIPRVTLQTVPRPLLKATWVIAVVLQGAVMIFVYVLVAWLTHYDVKQKRKKPNHKVAFGVLGIAQIIACLLTFLIPNEEYADPEDVRAPNGSRSATTSGQIRIKRRPTQSTQLGNGTKGTLKIPSH